MEQFCKYEDQPVLYLSQERRYIVWARDGVGGRDVKARHGVVRDVAEA